VLEGDLVSDMPIYWYIYLPLCYEALNLTGKDLTGTENYG
jgi:hypothetical protein